MVVFFFVGTFVFAGEPFDAFHTPTL
jgi:hypothetical protein